jgi:thiol-disulfide isomerase/thioredoxin
VWRLPEGARQAAFLGALALSCAHASAPERRPFAQTIEQLVEVNDAAGVVEGQPLVVQFFATWCFPCVASFPLLDLLQKTEGAKVQVLAIGMDLEGGPVLQPFVEKYRPSFPVLLADDAIRKGDSPFGKIVGLPATVAIDREGRAVASLAGAPDLPQLEELARRAKAE